MNKPLESIKSEQIKNSENPEERKNWMISNISTLSQNTKSIYLLYLGSLSYCAVTVVGTTDRQMILDEAVRLPIIGVDVPMTGFFIAGPILAIGLFIYLQLYLQELKSLRDRLYKEYPNIDREQLYPWMLNIADSEKSDSIRYIQRFFVSVVLWWMLPAILFLFAGYFMIKQDRLWCTIVGLLPIIGISIVIHFWKKYSGRRADTPKEWLIRKFSPRNKNDVFLTLIFLGQLMYAFVVFLTIHLSFYVLGGQYWMYTADLSHEILVTEQKSEYDTYWVHLDDISLQGADLEGAILLNASLKWADLSYSKLTNTLLKKANLTNTNLTGARFDQTNLQEAILIDTQLSLASMINSDLRKTTFDQIDAFEIIFSGSNFTSANISRLNIDKATAASVIFDSTRIQDASFSRSIFENASFRGSHIKAVNFSGVNLSGADFSGAVLDSVRFENADLEGASFYETQFLGSSTLLNANLKDAEFTNTNITADLLCEAKTFDPSLIFVEAETFVPSLIFVDRLKEEDISFPYDSTQTHNHDYSLWRELEEKCGEKLNYN